MTKVKQSVLTATFLQYGVTVLYFAGGPASQMMAHHCNYIVGNHYCYFKKNGNKPITMICM